MQNASLAGDHTGVMLSVGGQQWLNLGVAECADAGQPGQGVGVGGPTQPEGLG